VLVHQVQREEAEAARTQWNPQLGDFRPDAHGQGKHRRQQAAERCSLHHRLLM
jgi:hypothetical protein